MSDIEGKMYAIGDRNDGILYVITNPFRVAKVEKSEIETYASMQGKSYDEAFGDYARATMKVILENDFSTVPARVEEVLDTFQHMVAKGSTISDADFCFVSNVNLNDLTSNRSIYQPVQDTLENLTQGQEAENAASGNLQEKVESDE